jgi:alanyl-tRNA synthetase
MGTPEPEHDPRIESLPAAEIRRRFVDFFAERGHTVVPSSSLIPAGDPTLLFVNSGMVPFKDVFTGVEKRPFNRAVSYQRSLRVAGKHNDFEEVGRTPRHHTLFEMLGNWSFGDYFKREAIHWAWEFLTETLGVPADRLAATTYSDDEVAWNIWRDEIGLPPERMARWGDVDKGDDHNFWRMADTGPCGPCSEIHFDRGPHLSEGPECVPDHSEQCPRWLEIWNLVFMEFDQRADGRYPLPFTSVDTGMGLERMTSAVQQVASNYDTDLFAPIHARMRELLGHDPDEFEAERFSYQVIADHSRAAAFLIGDGVLPSNEGRGYVLRKLVRRAVRHGRLLGRKEPFLAQTAAVVIDVMKDAYPYLEQRREEILGSLLREESQFGRTLDAGTVQLEEALIPLTSAERVIGRRPEDLPADSPELSGDVAFRLHDTFGFPIDLTIELAAEYGVRVDRLGFDEALAEQRQRSRSGRKAAMAEKAEQAVLYQSIQSTTGDTTFLGYETTSAEGTVVAILRDGVEYDELEAKPDEELRTDAAAAAEIVLDQTPFYAEGGGQIGDHGVLRRDGPDTEIVFEVEDTQKPIGGLIVHRGMLRGRVRVGESLQAVVDADRRAHTMRNHTGTHLLHRALRNVVGERARQAGSLVTPDYLRFDFPLDRAVTDDEKQAIEDEVRGIVRDDRPVTIEFMTMAKAIEDGADAFFDEKYGETVRTIRVQDYSFELCGGTHCRATGQIGSFVITGERSIGSGMRRIEALTGAGADAWFRERLDILDRTSVTLGARSVEAAPDRAAGLRDELRSAERRASEKPPQPVVNSRERIADVDLLLYAVPFDNMERLKSYARHLRGENPDTLIAMGLDADEPEVFVTVPEALVKRGISAGDLVRDAVVAIDGKGGGRAEMAQGKGSRRDGLTDAFERIRTSVRTTLDNGSHAEG